MTETEDFDGRNEIISGAATTDATGDDKYAVFDAVGLPVAFYIEAIHGKEKVAEATRITHQQWREFLENPGCRAWDGENVIVYTPPEPSAAERAAVKDRLIQEAMSAEADPLFFRYQAGEIKKQVWLDKRAEIKARFAGV